MASKEKVIKGLECLAKQHGIVGVCEPENCPYGDLHTCANEIARDALALLKAQEAVKPIENAGFYYCGACRYAFTTAKQKYCSECGREVKWK